MLETMKGVLIEPSDTFREASRTANIGPALLYGLVLGFIGSCIGLFWQYFLGAAFGGASGMEGLPPEFRELLEFSGPTAMVVSLALAPVLLLVGLFVWSAIVHLMLLLLSGATHGYEATFRTVAYCHGSTALFQAVPFCGNWIGLIWSLVAQIIGIKEMHKISAGKAVAAVLVPLLLCCCAVFVLAFALASMIGSQVGGF
jgi:hypothetical protein